MASAFSVDQLLVVFRETIVGMVRRDGPDLSARQFGIMLVSYLTEGPHTVRGLSGTLDISKPAVTRSIDRLEELGLVQRGPDSRDGRSVLVLATADGMAFIAHMRQLVSAGMLLSQNRLERLRHNSA